MTWAISIDFFPPSRNELLHGVPVQQPPPLQHDARLAPQIPPSTPPDPRPAPRAPRPHPLLLVARPSISGPFSTHASRYLLIRGFFENLSKYFQKTKKVLKCAYSLK